MSGKGSAAGAPAKEKKVTTAQDHFVQVLTTLVIFGFPFVFYYVMVAGSKTRVGQNESYAMYGIASAAAFAIDGQLKRVLRFDIGTLLMRTVFAAIVVAVQYGLAKLTCDQFASLRLAMVGARE